MAVRIRCDGCFKKVSIDEAFVGGVCRCPYCKALVFVGGHIDTTAGGPRLAAPGQARPSRPRAPEELAEIAQARGQKEIPTADPVKLQGIVTIVLLGLLLVMIVGGIVLAVKLSGRQEQANGPGDEPDEQTSEAMMAGMLRIKPPVVYCLQAGKGNLNEYEGARVMTNLSIRTLSEDEEFTVVVCAGGKVRFLSEEFIPGGAAGAIRADEFLAAVKTGGEAPLVAGIRAAMARQPRSIVVLAWSKIEDEGLAVDARGRGVRILTVGIEPDPAASESLERLAEATGGRHRDLGSGVLDGYADELRKVEQGKQD